MEQLAYYNQKQNKVLYFNMEKMDFLPQPRFRARDFYYMAYSCGLTTKNSQIVIVTSANHDVLVR